MHLRDADGAVGGLALDLRRARQRMAFGSGDALLQELLLQLEDQLAVLGMHGRRARPVRRQRRKLVHQLLVVDHDGVLVGHEVLEAVDAVLAHERAHVVAHLLVPPGDRDMEGVVAGRLLRPSRATGR